MGATGSVLFAATTGFKAYGEYRAGRAQQQIDEFNARIAEFEAIDAIRRGEDEAYRFGEKVRKFIGTQKASYAGQGVDVTTGSPLDVMADTARAGELDRLMIMNNAAKEAWGFRTQGIGYRMSGQLAKQRGTYSALSTILTAGYGYYSRRK